MKDLLHILENTPEILPVVDTKSNYAIAIEERRHSGLYTCLRCDLQAAVAYVLTTKEKGIRWVDLCPSCSLWLRRELEKLMYDEYGAPTERLIDDWNIHNDHTESDNLTLSPTMDEDELNKLNEVIVALQDIHKAAKSGKRGREFVRTDLEEESNNLITLAGRLHAD